MFPYSCQFFRHLEHLIISGNDVRQDVCEFITGYIKAEGRDVPGRL